MVAKAEELGWKKDSNIHPWLYLIDYVDTQTAKPNFSTEVRAFLFDDLSPIWIAVKNALMNGHNIIVDTVFEYDPEYEKFMSYFKNSNCYKVLVYCPLNVLIERVRERNLLEIEAEKRTVFQSFEQFPAIYKLQENNDEKLIDVISSSRKQETLLKVFRCLKNLKYVKLMYYDVLKKLKR